MLRFVIGLLCLAAATNAVGADVCPLLRSQQAAPDAATRIAAVACSEHLLWYRPFIDTAGRLASTSVSEAEASRLDDGGTLAWQRVASYWRDSGLLPQMAGVAGAPECGYAGSDHYAATQCRSFVLDQAWSAAFISWVMRRAALPGFRGSASHVDYVRDAYLRPDESAFVYLDPATTRPATGDLLCYVRMPERVLGYEGLRQALGNDDPQGLPMHCDVVVAANPGNDGTAYLVGGNVQQAVTMRLLPLNRGGLFWSLPRRAEVDPDCSPDTAAACNLSRQDWAVLLKLKPAQGLAGLAPPLPILSSRVQAQPACCVNCVVGAVPPVPRCPKPPVP
ncbi:DUF2272 domain-containing protein [Lysobacter koreensis]|uniref:DUF2272 domain-containing protein n=1 Tax=Lysobacter koreensis TaxID=266122 RepID=A0ABW2YK07_9GAMM